MWEYKKKYPVSRVISLAYKIYMGEYVGRQSVLRIVLQILLSHHQENTMTKNEAIKRVNGALGSPLLNERNTHWASVVPCRRRRLVDSHSLAAVQKGNPHPAVQRKGQVFPPSENQGQRNPQPGHEFRCKDQVADIFISAASPRKLADILAGGTKHNFSKHIVSEYRF